MITKEASETRVFIQAKEGSAFSARIRGDAITLDQDEIVGWKADNVERIALLLLACVGEVRHKAYTVTEVSLEDSKVYRDIMREGAVL